MERFSDDERTQLADFLERFVVATDSVVAIAKPTRLQ
jgi:hypothetical protein